MILLFFIILLLSSSTLISCFLPFNSKRFTSNGGMHMTRPLSWSNCGDTSKDSEDLFILESLEITPDPPQRSAPLTVHLKGFLKETLDEGIVDYSVKFGGFQLATGKLDGCPALQKEPNLPQCPVSHGKIDVTHTVQLPWHIPPGRYLIKARGERSRDQKQIFCLDLDLAIDLISE